MKAYEQIQDEQLTALIKSFLDWSGGDIPPHNIWDSNDKEDQGIPKVTYFVDFWCNTDEEKELIEDWCTEEDEMNPDFLEKLNKIVEQIQSSWK